MGKLNMNLLKGIEEQESVIDRSKQEQEETRHIAQDTPQVSQNPNTPLKQQQPQKNTYKEEKVQNRVNTKVAKAVMGFRAEIEKMENWKLYASVTGQEIGILCTAAIDEYINRHKLTAEQQQLFNLKKQTLEAEKRMRKHD